MTFRRLWTIAACLLLVARMDAVGREVLSLNEAWKFHQGELPDVEKPEFDDASWRTLEIPHDWSIEGKFDAKAATGGDGGWLPSGVAWYRKRVSIPASAAGMTAWIEFDGVMANSRVWWNGQLLGQRPNGYASFRYDVSSLIRPGGENTLMVCCDTSAQPASRWYTGAGIYRKVRLVIAPPSHIEPWGVFVTTPEVNASSAVVKIKTSIRFAPDREALKLRSRVETAEGREIAVVETQLPAPQDGRTELDHELRISNPALWSTEAPMMHHLTTTLISGNQIIDETRTSFGIRKPEFRTDTGFWLNGKNLKLKGVCLHHDGGALGAAVPAAVWQRRLERLRQLGVNAIRTAHNPPDPGFLDLCDRMGFLVMDEFFDAWTKAKRPHDYHRHFKEWSSADLRDGILRDRNHPSVILYSVGNEIHDTARPDSAKATLGRLMEVCREADPTRPVTMALFRPNSTGDYQNGLADMLDVIGTNYRDKELLQAWRDKPGRRIIGTEQGHERSTWLACRDNAPHAGQFLWAGIDYLGESRRWPLTVYNAGLLDRAGFVQPRGCERRSWWSGEPMVKMFRRVARTAATPEDPGYEPNEWLRDQVLFPDWNPRKPGEQTIEVYSNCDEVELKLNGRSLGSRKLPADAAPRTWKAEWEPGVLEAIARNDGKQVATDRLQTAGKPARLEITSDRKSLGTSWDEVANLEILITDEAGIVVPDSAREIRCRVSGPGSLLAMDNGDPYDTTPFQSSTRKSHQGRCLAILRATGVGTLRVTVEADDCQPAQIEIATGK